jgi:hypothetical protein
VCTMNELQKIKQELERTLRTEIGVADWLDLQEDNVLREYYEQSWSEFRGWIEERLRRLRRYRQNVRREEAGDLKEEDAASNLAGSREVEEASPPIGLRIGRTWARSRAMAALDQLRAGDIGATGRARISSTSFPRGGVDGTIPQWVILMAVEAWIPAAEVAESYSRLQQPFLAERRPPKTSERAFQVARFVWEEERIHRARPSWPVLCERWNHFPLTEPFERWRDFRTSFQRGATATPPRYVLTNEQITDLVRSRSQQGNFDSWASEVRE